MVRFKSDFLAVPTETKVVGLSKIVAPKFSALDIVADAPMHCNPGANLRNLLIIHNTLVP